MAYFFITGTDFADQLREEYPNGNVIFREDYQKSFKKKVRWEDTKHSFKSTPPPRVVNFCDHEAGLGHVVPKLYEW